MILMLKGVCEMLCGCIKQEEGREKDAAFAASIIDHEDAIHHLADMLACLF